MPEAVKSKETASVMEGSTTSVSAAPPKTKKTKTVKTKKDVLKPFKAGFLSGGGKKGGRSLYDDKKEVLCEREMKCKKDFEKGNSEWGEDLVDEVYVSYC